MKNHRRARRASYSLPLPPVLLLGSILAISFYGLIFTGPLDIGFLRRYCLSHPVAVASVSLFCVGIVALSMKWFFAATQTRVTGRAVAALRRLLSDGEEIAPAGRPEWLLASWDAQPAFLRDSWLGLRIVRVLELQIRRGRRQQLEADLNSIGELDADRQHDSYSLLRIIHWAMPMLGFLGTVLGISQTLGQLDTEMLATQQQAAMNQLTAGLYVAFDTTAIALTLTVCSMFVQFAVSRIEINLLTRIDSDLADCLVGYLAVDPFDAQETLLTPVREMATHLLATAEQLVEQQSAVWARSIAESQRQWSAWTGQASEQVEQRLGATVSQALEKHVASMRKLQDEGSRQIDLRWQQWQTTLSDQARAAQSQQKEMIRQSDILQQLVESTVDLRKLEEAIHESVGRLEDVGRIEQASLCVGEAVAVLATSLERAGLIRGAPVRPRPAKKVDAENALQDTSDTLPVDSQRKSA